MNLAKNQHGVGLVEVLVALLILAIGVMGYVMLQARALEATAESAQRVQAMNIARDFAERVRVNREAWGPSGKYVTEMSVAANQKNASKDCHEAGIVCTPAELADFDVSEVVNYASGLGMTMNLMPCKTSTNSNSPNGRYCVYVAWGETAATNGSTDLDCTNGAAYRPRSTCIIMEVYQ